MKRKVGTIMEDSLFRRAKLEAVRQGRRLAAVIEEARRRHFASEAPHVTSQGESRRCQLGRVHAFTRRRA